MEIKRDVYLDKLIRKKKNGLIKVVTGVRRCGKSYLLFHLFHDHLLDSGVTENHIIEIALDDRSNKELRDPDVILKFIKESIKDKEDYYIILDEVQYLDEFEDVGLRNARLGFRQIEETHLMENIIYNELRVRGYHVDVGVVECYETKADGKRGKKQLEVGFVATNCNQQIYRAYHFRASVLTDWCSFYGSLSNGVGVIVSRLLTFNHRANTEST